MIMVPRITEDILENYRNHLREEEKSPLTIEKYLRDIRKLKDYLAGKKPTKEKVIEFKEKLYKQDHFKISSVNSIIESVNRFFEFMKWYELRVKPYKVQRENFTPEERYMTREEYKRLLQEARKQGNKRLYLIMETLASTGMRVSEINYVTVQAARSGIIEVHNKGKIRKVLLTRKMQTQLLRYIKEQKIGEGYVFCTRSGKPVDRSNIWKEMKKLCQGAKVNKTKIFPHNLRKLFAVTLYKVQRDITKLADILGHSSIEVTRRYLRETTKEHRKSLEMLNLTGAMW